MKNSLVVSMAFLGLVLLSGCRSESSKLKEEFVDGCKNSGGSASICKCAYNELEDHYGAKQLAKINRTGDVPSDFVQKLAEAAQECR